MGREGQALEATTTETEIVCTPATKAQMDVPCCSGPLRLVHCLLHLRCQEHTQSTPGDHLLGTTSRPASGIRDVYLTCRSRSRTVLPAICPQPGGTCSAASSSGHWHFFFLPSAVVCQPCVGCTTFMMPSSEIWPHTAFARISESTGGHARLLHLAAQSPRFRTSHG